MSLVSIIQHATRMHPITLPSVACRLYNFFFPHYLINRHDFPNKKITEHKMRISFFLCHFAKVSHSKKNSPRRYRKCTYGSMQRACHSCQILIKLELSRQTFERYSNTKFQENPSRCSTAVTCGRTDRHTDAILRKRLKTE